MSVEAGLTENILPVVQYTYDNLGRINTAFAGNTQYARFSYNLIDQITNMTYGNGLIASYTYDHLARSLNITLSSSKQLLSLASIHATIPEQCPVSQVKLTGLS